MQQIIPAKLPNLIGEGICVSKVYQGGVSAVNSVSIDIADGEFMVLLGPSGCGKSTTLRMIAGLEKIADGDLAIDGARMNDVPAKDRDIAMVFQSYALYPHMSVRKNLAFGLRRRGFDRKTIDGRVSEAARMLGLSDLLERKPHALSGGQRQRVALGRAVVRDPKVFLFDEPLSNLDAALRVSTRGELIKQHQRLAIAKLSRQLDYVHLAIVNHTVVMRDFANEHGQNNRESSENGHESVQIHDVCFRSLAAWLFSMRCATRNAPSATVVSRASI